MEEKLQSARALHRSLSERIYQKCVDIYSHEEAGHIATMLMEHYLSLRRTDILIDRQLTLDARTENLLRTAVERLAEHEPIQYVIGESFFYGRAFYVNPSVLVPRRETEELTDIIIRQNKTNNGLKILDVGTGSGCIAITLQKELIAANVTAVDISQEALAVAKANAIRHQAELQWVWSDIMQYAENKQAYDIIVSNPPYVREIEAREMKKNVLNYEPYSALFVKNKEPLIFYDKIAQLCVRHKLLKAKGKLFFEINEHYGTEVVAILKRWGFDQVTLQKDMQGKDRFVIGRLNS